VPSFAVIAEGVTDQAVLENILLGFFGDREEPPVVNCVQPPREPRVKGRAPPPGGWTLVFRALRAGDHRKALQNNDYVLVHLDTDVAEEPGYDVSRRAADGRVLSPAELAEQVRLRLMKEMGDAFCAQHGSRVVFAIAVDAIECWLLPLLHGGEPAKQAKTTGCLDAADRKLRLLGRPLLSAAGGKSLAGYEGASRDYMKRRKLMGHRGDNPSLDVFVKNLEALGGTATRETGTAAGDTPGPPAGEAEAPGGEHP
jgi:hypothetical protein